MTLVILHIESGELKRHNAQMHDGQKFSCDQCQKEYPAKFQLNGHIRRYHEGIKQSHHGNKQFTLCNYCGKGFNYRNNLRIHIGRIHEKGEKFKSNYKNTTNLCSRCGKDFATPQSLKIHDDAVHKGIKHTCLLCKRSFSTKHYLNSHMKKAHNNDKNKQFEI